MDLEFYGLDRHARFFFFVGWGVSLELAISNQTNAILCLCSSVQNSERGKKIGNVMATTSRNVVQTGKAVGKKFVH